VWAIGTKDHCERNRVQMELARRLMDTLKNQGKYRLMLVDDVQRKLEEFIPGVAN
jgi:hypothetical protein